MSSPRPSGTIHGSAEPRPHSHQPTLVSVPPSFPSLSLIHHPHSHVAPPDSCSFVGLAALSPPLSLLAAHAHRPLASRSSRSFEIVEIVEIVDRSSRESHRREVHGRAVITDLSPASRPLSERPPCQITARSRSTSIPMTRCVGDSLMDTASLRYNLAQIQPRSLLVRDDEFRQAVDHLHRLSLVKPGVGHAGGDLMGRQTEAVGVDRHVLESP